MTISGRSGCAAGETVGLAAAVEALWEHAASSAASATADSAGAWRLVEILCILRIIGVTFRVVWPTVSSAVAGRSSRWIVNSACRREDTLQDDVHPATGETQGEARWNHARLIV